MKKVAGALLVLLAAFAGITWLALESGGVAVVETHTPAGGIRSTHVWYVEPDGELWLEAGTPENGWLLDVQRDPRIRFRADGREGDYLARPSDDRARHAELRQQLREKYGWRDGWVSIYVDQSRSLAVRLEPATR